MKKIYFLLFFVIFGFTIVLRLYKLSGPVADWHSWRQSDTAAVARNFLKFGFDPLRPRFDDLSNIPSGFDNPEGWRMEEFPLYQLIGAGLYRFFPKLPIEIWLRLVTIVASSGTAVLLGLVVAAVADPFTGLTTTFIFSVLPYSVYYGRTILPDPFMVFWSVLSLLLLVLIKGGKRDWGLLILSAFSAAIALLAKPVAIFLLLPAPYLLYKRFHFSKKLVIGLLVYCLFGLLPLIWWRRWETNFPEGIAVYTWLFNAGNIRFKGAWFYWLFWQRLADLILGSWGLILFALGLILPVSKKEGSLFRWWLAGALAYLIIIARGNVQHDYYQILMVPVICIFAAKGLVFLFTSKAINRFAGIGLGLVSIVFALAFSWYTVRTYYWINRPEIVEAGKVANRLLPKNAKVVAPYGGDTTFLYQINRQGWPIGFEIDKKIAMGAAYYVTVSPTDNDFETRDLAKKYTVIIRNDKFAIIDLTHPK